jgi:hypothetical protein
MPPVRTVRIVRWKRPARAPKANPGQKGRGKWLAVGVMVAGAGIIAYYVVSAKQVPGTTPVPTTLQLTAPTMNNPAVRAVGSNPVGNSPFNQEVQGSYGPSSWAPPIATSPLAYGGSVSSGPIFTGPMGAPDPATPLGRPTLEQIRNAGLIGQPPLSAYSVVDAVPQRAFPTGGMGFRVGPATLVKGSAYSTVDAVPQRQSVYSVVNAVPQARKSMAYSAVEMDR